MRKKKANGSGEVVTVDAGQYNAMVETMIELAMRNAPTEAIVLRCAKAGGVKEVVKHITRMRVYAKKHRTPQRESNGTEQRALAAAKHRSKKKRTSSQPPPSEREYTKEPPAVQR